MLTHGLPTVDFQNFITTRDLFDIEAIAIDSLSLLIVLRVLLLRTLIMLLLVRLYLWEEVELLILPMVSSDHHPICLHTSLEELFAPSPFLFQDMWTHHEAFLPFVRDYWAALVPFGNRAITLITKLKRLKALFRD